MRKAAGSSGTALDTKVRAGASAAAGTALALVLLLTSCGLVPGPSDGSGAPTAAAAHDVGRSAERLAH